MLGSRCVILPTSLGIKQASLYYHFPGGKEQLFLTMAERMFERHRQGIVTALAEGEHDWRAQLREVSNWFSSQRPIKFMGMMHACILARSTKSILHRKDTPRCSTRYAKTL